MVLIFFFNLKYMVKLVTVVTHDDCYFKYLEMSCKRYNVDLIKLR